MCGVFAWALSHIPLLTERTLLLHSACYKHFAPGAARTSSKLADEEHAAPMNHLFGAIK